MTCSVWRTISPVLYFKNNLLGVQNKPMAQPKRTMFTFRANSAIVPADLDRLRAGPSTGVSMNRPIQSNRYQYKPSASRFTIRGVSVARLLVCLLLSLNVILIYTILFSSHGLPGYKKQNRQVKELEEKVLKLKTENQKLFEMVQTLKTNPKAQEKLVRHELGWVRENEIVIESADKANGGGDKAAMPIRPFDIPK